MAPPRRRFISVLSTTARRRNEIRPLVAGVHALAAVVQAQEEFLAKRRMGKIILVP